MLLSSSSEHTSGQGTHSQYRCMAKQNIMGKRKVCIYGYVYIFIEEGWDTGHGEDAQVAVFPDLVLAEQEG